MKKRVMATTMFLLSLNGYALEPVLTSDDIKKAIVIDSQKLYKSSDSQMEVHGSCGSFGVITVEGVEATYANEGLSVSSIELRGKKNYKISMQMDAKLQLGDSFRKLVCTRMKDKTFLVIESYIGMGAANEPSPANYVFDASNGNLITDNCNNKCLRKYNIKQ